MRNLYHLALFSLLIVFNSSSLLGQNENWYFGFNAGLTFSTNPPTPLINGQISSYEACASISDVNGNLLFYSDGEAVWNRNHIIMTNGNGLHGHESTTQGVLIIPNPGDSNQYYVFTLDQLGGGYGLKYSVVDMTLQSGIGAVTTKNVGLNSNVTEKLAAIQRCDGNIWVVYHEWPSNDFIARLITPAGIGVEVISSVGMVHTGGGGGIKNSIGYLKISAAGDKLAVGILDVPAFEVLDFDISTGAVSNPLTLSPTGISKAYALEFSPDGSLLYTADQFSGKIYQFDLMAGTPTAIANSGVLIGTSANAVGGLQVGRDGKIYISRNTSNDLGQSYLAVINNPNQIGTGCNFVDNGIYLGGKKSRWALPNDMVTMLAVSPLTISGDTSICAGDTAILTVSGSFNVQWVKGFSAATSTISVTPGSTTTYSAVDPNSVCGDTVSITVKVDTGGGLQITASDTLLCPGDSVTLSATGPGAAGNFQWSGGGLNSSQPMVTVAPQATTQYYLSGGNGLCAGNDTVTLHVFQQLQSGFTYAASPCGLTVDFNSTTVGADTYNWDFGDNSSASGATVNHLYTAPGTYRVTLEVINTDCNLTDTISEVIVVSDSVAKPEILIRDHTGCMDGTVNFEVENPAPRYTYKWDFDNGSYSSSITPQVKYSNTGTYSIVLIVEDTLCGKVYSDTALLSLENIYTEVLIPNCFTPNEDGINELFTISGSPCRPGDVMEIYNRWGSLVFRSENPYEEFWDGKFAGKPCSQGVYYYLFFTQNEVKRGIITLMR